MSHVGTNPLQASCRPNSYCDKRQNQQQQPRSFKSFYFFPLLKNHQSNIRGCQRWRNRWENEAKILLKHQWSTTIDQMTRQNRNETSLPKCPRSECNKNLVPGHFFFRCHDFSRRKKSDDSYVGAWPAIRCWKSWKLKKCFFNDDFSNKQNMSIERWG